MLTYLSTPQMVCFDNDNDATKPQWWANIGLMLLEEAVAMAPLVNREFENEFAEAGDIVHTYRSNKFRMKRKGSADVSEQDAVLDKIQLPLDQHNYVSFRIKDREWSLNAKDLVRIHLAPAVATLARGADRAITGQVHRFIKTPEKRVGRLNGLSPSTTREWAIAAQESFDLANVPEDNRRLLLSPRSRSHFLNTDLIVQANTSGDQQNRAMRQAFLGDLFGFQTYKSNNMVAITDDATDTASGTVTNAMTADEVTSLEAVTITGYEVTAGEWAVVAGNDQPQYITAATTGAGDTTAVTLNEKQKYASSSSAAIKVYKKCLSTAAYAVGYEEDITVDNHTANKGPQVGQLIATGTGASRKLYTIIEAEAVSTTSTKILLDRPLEAAIANNDALFPGPSGVFNLAFHRDALSLVSRPLAVPGFDIGASFAFAASDTFGLRVMMQYQGKGMGTLVNIDNLLGLALLDLDMATLVLG